VLHIGTHKTGSTALQLMLANNRAALLERGILIPRTGVDPDIPVGHHRLAAALRSGTATALLRDLVEELRASGAPLAILSSEEFSSLASQPQTLDALAQALTSAGYRTTVLAYFRPQDAFAESLYGELVRGRNAAFEPFTSHVLRTCEAGGFAPHGPLEVWLDYPRMVAPFAERFGRGAILARSYLGRGTLQSIYHDFFAALTAVDPRLGGAPIQIEIRQASANESLAFGGLLEIAHARLHGESCAHDFIGDVFTIAPDLDRATFVSRFSLLLRDESLALLERFADSNIALEREYGLRVPFVQTSDIAPESELRWSNATRQRAIFDRVLELWR
jgi:hypothetical protein